jgi:hypothetical protein
MGRYRIQLNIGSDLRPISLLMPQHIEDAYEIYLDGQLIGSLGKLVGFHLSYHQQPKLFSFSSTE